MLVLCDDCDRKGTKYPDGACLCYDHAFMLGYLKKYGTTYGVNQKVKRVARWG